MAADVEYKTHWRADIAFMAMFVLVLWLPIADKIFGLDRSRAPIEKRKLAEKPVFSLGWEAVVKYPTKYDAYFNDHFGYRNWLINWHSDAKVKWLGMVSSPKVMEGKEGWLFFTGDRIIEFCCRATKPFSAEQLAEWQRVLEDRRDWLAERGIRFLITVVPNKHTIYPEYLPGWLTRVGEKSRLEQFMEHMQANSDVEILDLRDAFFEAKKHERLFHRTDTHWNDEGAFVAYREIMSRLSKWFPDAKPLSRVNFTCQQVMERGGDLARLIGQQSSIKEERLVFLPKKPRHAQRVDPEYLLTIRHWRGRGDPVVMECENGQIPRAVMFRDSLAVALIPFLSEHFGRMACLWTHRFDREIIERERPNVVIHEIGERLLTKIRNPEYPDEEED